MRYIGSKAKILGFIGDTVENTYGSVKGAVIADLFAGTCCVAEMFKKKGARLITNDYMRFSYAMQVARIKLNEEPVCKIRYREALERLNALKGMDGFFFREYTLEGTKDARYRRNYFDSRNARKADAICTQLKAWREQGDISSDMFYLLSAGLVDAIASVSNTSGTYGAFLKIDDRRMYKPLEIKPFRFTDNGCENEAYCSDISALIDDVAGDILYLDPPYNSRQYPPYYHILETAVMYDEPHIYGVTGRRPYRDMVSPFCMKDKALASIVDIVKRARFRHIYISYSTDGIIDIDKLSAELAGIGEVERFYHPYRRYKSNSGGNTQGGVKEMIIYVKKR